MLRAQRAWLDVFGLQARITRQPDRCTGLVVSSKRLVEFMELLQCGSRASNKKVPCVIAEGRRDHALAFLQGAALDAYVTHAGAAKWAICLESHPAIDGLQDLVTRLGVVNAQISKYNRTYDKTYFELYAAGARAGAAGRCRFLNDGRRANAYLSRQVVRHAIGQRTALHRAWMGRRLRQRAGWPAGTSGQRYWPPDPHPLVRSADTDGVTTQCRASPAHGCRAPTVGASDPRRGDSLCPRHLDILSCASGRLGRTGRRRRIALLRDGRGVVEEVRRHRREQPPGDGDRSITGVRHVGRGAEE